MIGDPIGAFTRNYNFGNSVSHLTKLFYYLIS